MFDVKASGKKVTGSQIKSVALEIASRLGVVNFSGSNGWLCSFLKRQKIILSEFNGDSDTSIQLIKLKRSFDPNAYAGMEFDEGEIQEPPVKSEIEPYEEEEVIEDYLTYTAEWKNWCRLCCSSSTVTDYYPNLNEVIQRLFGIEPDNQIKLCDTCQSKVLDINHFMDKGKVAENMFCELEELEIQNTISDDIASKIRKDYGFDNNDEIVYESLDMEAEDSFPQNDETVEEIDTIEEFIYEENELQNVAETAIVGDQTNHISIKEEEPTTIANNSKIDESEYDFVCHICDETFERMFFLTNHTREQHSCLPQVACNTCGKYLATWETLVSHRKKHFTENATFECFFCSAKFVTQTGLSIHNKIKHEKNNPNGAITRYSCGVCGKEFKDCHVLKNHMRVHLSDEEKFPIVCEICEKRLANKYSLKHHIATVHEQTKNVSCNLCNKTFSSKSNLRSHLISHSTENIKCPVCGLIFKNRVSYQSHKKMHKDNAKNFSCPECGKLFFNRHHLQRHRIAHSEARNFKCDQCDMAYKWVSFLNFQSSSAHNFIITGKGSQEPQTHHSS